MLILQTPLSIHWFLLMTWYGWSEPLNHSKQKLCNTYLLCGYETLFLKLGQYARLAQVFDVSPHDLRHHFGYRMAEVIPLHRLAQIMGHNSLDTTMLSIRGIKQDLQQDVEKIVWI